MTPDVVVDVGNTRIKWGTRRPDGTLVIDHVHLEYLNLGGLRQSLAVAHDSKWVIAGSNPERQSQLAQWARGEGATVVEITSYQQVPIIVEVEHPGMVGLDRLLGAVAANRLRTPGRVALTVDVGTAVTVNRIDGHGVFTGGMILPGVRLMTRSLHENTAKLPLIESDSQRFRNRTFPGKSTAEAIRAGVSYAIVGAVRLALDHAKVDGKYPQLFLTGGGAASIRELLLDHKGTDVPTLVLDGLVITAESLP